MKQSLRMLLVVFTFAFLLFSSLWSDVTLTDAENKTYQGQSVEFTKTEAVMSSPDASLIKVDYNDIAEIRFSPSNEKFAAPDDYFRLGFTNNDILYGTISDTGKEGFRFYNRLIGERTINFERLAYIQRANPFPGLATIPVAVRKDVVVLNSGDVDNGVTMELASASIKIKSALYEKEMIYNLSDIRGISFFSLTAAQRRKEHSADLKAVVYLRDDSMLTGMLSSPEKGVYELASDSASYRIPAGAISFIYFRNNRCTYLSDLEPLTVKEYATQAELDPANKDSLDIPFLWHYQNDRQVNTGLPILWRGRRYFKALAVHSNCELTYKLDGSFRRFQALIMVDDEIPKGASDSFEGTVRFSVWADGKKIYTSEILKKDSELAAIDLDIKDAKELRLVLDDAGDNYILDRAFWTSARLVK